VVADLLAAGADPNPRGVNGTSALIATVVRGHLETLEVLLKHGADPNAATDAGITPLMAAAGGNSAAAQILLEHGADSGAADNQGMDALFFAAMNGDVKLVTALIQRGANPFRAAANGVTAAGAAESAGHTELAAILRSAAG
jgi:ankyrin repeat protein